MGKPIKDTIAAKVMTYDQQMDNIIRFLLQEPDTMVDHYVLKNLLETKLFTTLPVNDIFSRMMQRGCIDEFVTLVINKKRVSTTIPELLVSPSFVIDVSNQKTSEALRVYRERYNKIVMNITPIVKMDVVGRPTGISDVNELHTGYVRGLLCRKYALDMNGTWLNPAMYEFMIRSYAFTISSVISRSNNLDFVGRKKVMFCLALYMAQQLSRPGENLAKPGLMNKCTFLGNLREIDDMCVEVEHITKNGLDLPGLCALFSTVGDDRLAGIDMNNFIALGSFVSPPHDKLTNILTLEYAPYWAHTLLQAVSGARLPGLTTQLKNNSLMDDAKLFAKNMSLHNELFDVR